MELSIFLARFLGVYLFIFLCVWIFRKEQVCYFIEGLFSNNTLLALSGMISLMIGVAIVVGHPVLEFNWKGLITLLGYFAILKGIVRLGFPSKARQYSVWVMCGPGHLLAVSLLALLSLYFIYHGFLA